MIKIFKIFMNYKKILYDIVFSMGQNQLFIVYRGKNFREILILNCLKLYSNNLNVDFGLNKVFLVLFDVIFIILQLFF